MESLRQGCYAKQGWVQDSMWTRMLRRRGSRLLARVLTAPLLLCPCRPYYHFSQYLHQDPAYNSILVWKDDKDPLGVRIPGT